MHGWADAVWDVGIAFGTVGVRKGDHNSRSRPTARRPTTGTSRKPEVTTASRWRTTCVRRDFTVNAMAVRLPGLELVDLHDGLADLRAGRSARRERPRTPSATTRCG